jgi:DNA-directed RNA polymerase subunit RpoE
MFQIARLEDPNVKILPENLGKPRLTAITQVIEDLYVDKVVKDLGLVVTLYEIVSIEGGTVYPGEGSAHFHVVFKAVVFRPFVGEVLEGVLKKADRKGLYVHLGFFNDVFVPEHMLQEPSAFDEEEQLWVWNYQNSRMFMDLDEPVRFRCSSVRFPEQPRNAKALDGNSPLLGRTYEGNFAPMVIVGDVNADGLGLTSWWQQETE